MTTVAVGAATVVLPRLGPGQWPLPFAAAAFHPLTLVVTTGFALLATAVCLVRRRGLIPPLLTAVTVVVTGAAAVAALPSSPQTDPARVIESGNGSIRILSWNTDQDDVPLATVVALIEQTHPDIVALPEYFTRLATDAFADVAGQRDYQILGWDASASTVLISRRLGTYHLDNSATPPWAGLLAVPDASTSPRVLVAHLQRPSPTSTATWRRHVDWARQQCAIPGTLAVGDFNATTTNLPGSRLGDCQDAATALGQHPVGTWPTSLPASLGATIDHLFVGRGYRAAAFGVIAGQDHAGSDHRPIFAIAVPT